MQVDAALCLKLVCVTGDDSKSSIENGHTMNSSFDVEPFKAVDTDPGGTLSKFTLYTERLELYFKLIFRKSDGTAFTPTDEEKKALLLLKGGNDMKNLFTHVGKIVEGDNYAATVKKIKDGLTSRVNHVVQRNMLLANYPQGKKSFERWSVEISDSAKLINYDDYNWEKAAVDAIILQTSNPKLRERALQDNVSYDELIKLGITKEQSAKGAAMLEEACGKSYPESTVEDEVRRLTLENKELKTKYKNQQGKNCGRCGRNDCPQGNGCFAQ